MKPKDAVKEAATDLEGRLKQLRSGDEQDLGKLAQGFDGIAEEADRMAQTLNHADRVLAGEEEPDASPEPGRGDDARA